ncbi:unnamed protein product [Symbiodinium sp. CCMP2456]|nr:unnamed protein product [Symbiodinium sp. CCMP2456]
MGDRSQPELDCCSQVKDGLEGVVGALLSMAMGLVLITLGLPAFLLVGSLDLLGNLYEACGGDRKDWTLFVVGADKPDDVPEQCNREAAGKTEAMRGQGPWPNFVYHLRNNHPVFGVFCCEYGHPFSPVERMGLLVLLLSFAYFMAGLKARGQESKGSFEAMQEGYCMLWSAQVKFVDYTKHTHWNDQWDWLWIDCYSLVCITLPSMVLQTMLKYFALLNYKYVLNKYSYFAKMREQRCRTFARQFCVDRGLGMERPRARRQQGTGFGECDCLEKCCKLFCKLSDACKACNNSCEDGKAQAVNSLFASLFAGLAFAGSCVFVVLGIRLDMDVSEDVWRSLCIGAGLNFFLLWFLQAIAYFALLWQYQHWEGPRFWLLGQEVPPHPELWVEMRRFFRLLDRNNDGLISKEEMSEAVRSLLNQELSEEGWTSLLREFDADDDGRLSLREFEGIRSEFAAKAGWWTRPEAP